MLTVTPSHELKAQAAALQSKDREDAAFIVRAVNAHDDLVKALERLYRHGQKQGWHDGYADDMDFAKGALSKAKEVQ